MSDFNDDRQSGDDNEKEILQRSKDQQANSVQISNTEEEELREAKDQGKEDIEKQKVNFII